MINIKKIIAASEWADMGRPFITCTSCTGSIWTRRAMMCWWFAIWTCPRRCREERQCHQQDNKYQWVWAFGVVCWVPGLAMSGISNHTHSHRLGPLSLQLRNIRTAVNLNGPKTASGSDRQDFHPPVESHIIPPITAQKKCLAQVRGLVNSSPVLYRSLVGGLEHGFYFSIYWECHHPNWRTPSFFRGVR